MVEIDIEVINVCKEYFPDIAKELNCTDPRFDLIIGDGI